MLSSYTALQPPINLGLVLAARTLASPILLFSSLTGTATFLMCIPIRVPPMSIPPSALISSTATGSLNVLYAVVPNEPPALGCGTTLTISENGTAARSTIIALLRCSQH